MHRQAKRSLERLLPRLKAEFSEIPPEVWNPFQVRLELHFEQLFDLLLHFYGQNYDFFYHLENILNILARMWIDRPTDLKTLDAQRETNPFWFQSEQIVGGMCYTRLFGGNLAGIREKIPYFKKLGLTYLHLMPLFSCPPAHNDGGYAVSNYREVNPELGTTQQLAELAAELRRNGISLVLDFVYNHTSDEHEWAQHALSGDLDYQEYYFMFPDRQMPDAYQAHLRDIFPETRQGAFTYRPEINKWVWTTFQSYQWDLNYQNPEVFARMAEEMLFLANVGVEVLRLDAVPFAWKQLGTPCENLPEVYLLIQAFNILARIAAPAMLFKSEAIVAPDDVSRYIGSDKCQLSYNPLLMALLWETLATREIRLLQRSMQKRFKLSPECAWVNYVRCHDDIGWTFDDKDAWDFGINGFDHRQFLNAFYTGQHPGSFARGLPYQFNPITKDARIAGTCASLAGLEKALQEETGQEVELAIRRILLIHSVILTAGGIPLLYLGDELGTINDYTFRNDPATVSDNRWVHRIPVDWGNVSQRLNENSVEARIYHKLCHLIELRKGHPAFAGGHTEFVETGSAHVFGYIRQHEDHRMIVLSNFIEQAQRITANKLRLHGLGYAFTDIVTERRIACDQDLILEPYQFVWLKTI